MKIENSQYYEIAKWAVGGTQDINEVNITDDDILFQVLKEQRVIGRFLKRMKSDYPKKFSNELIEKLSNFQNDIEVRNRNFMKVLNELNEVIDSRNSSYIVIKGFSYYALTGESQSIRYSTDIDLFCNEFQLLKAGLSSINFVDTNEFLSPHEIGNMIRNNIVMDVHNYFPVLSYPKIVQQQKDYLPDQFQGYWFQKNQELRVTKIYYNDLLENSTFGITVDTNNIKILEPCMLILILCAHIFKDYVWEPYKVDLLRLGELAEINDLCKHEKFDKNKLLELIEKYDAKVAVSFVRHLLIAFFECCNLPSFNFSEERLEWVQFPQKMVGIIWGPWVSLNNPYQLLDRNIDAIVNHIGANEIITSSLNKKNIYSTYSKDKNKNLARVIHWSKEIKKLEIEITIDWDSENISFNILIMDDLLYVNEYVRINFGTPLFSEWCYINEKQEIKGIIVDKDGIKMKKNEKGHSIRFIVPWSKLPNHSPSNHSLSVMLNVKRIWNNIDKESVVIPIEIIRGNQT
ncbi:nucleotidyltransferase family protein [Paenibacillus periandrae]|uniref:nucleotidyltransferase family protein n=1 Tax=Paenibacillus periandrae TaxID=1761741 RepID=UPI001F093541|nr:nucleotidyltransferase family protein [Paenibacillus periandrae]